MSERDYLAERFEEHRTHLRAVAYRMLGSVGDVDDAVQEAWLRLSRADAAEIDNLGGWLTTVVARVCLDMRRSRCFAALESPRVHVVATSEERPEQSDLRFRRRSLIDRSRDQVHEVDFVCSAAEATWSFTLHPRVREQQYHSVADTKALQRTPESILEGVTTRVLLS